MTLSIQLGAPAISAVVMIDMFLGIINRLAPQVQIVFLGMPLKSWIGLMFLFVASQFIFQQFGIEALRWLKTVYGVIVAVPH